MREAGGSGNWTGKKKGRGLYVRQVVTVQHSVLQPGTQEVRILGGKGAKNGP